MSNFSADINNLFQLLVDKMNSLVQVGIKHHFFYFYKTSFHVFWHYILIWMFGFGYNACIEIFHFHLQVFLCTILKVQGSWLPYRGFPACPLYIFADVPWITLILCSAPYCMVSFLQWGANFIKYVQRNPEVSSNKSFVGIQLKRNWLNACHVRFPAM